jgi:hypothetical protein
MEDPIMKVMKSGFPDIMSISGTIFRNRAAKSRAGIPKNKIDFPYEIGCKVRAFKSMLFVFLGASSLIPLPIRSV